MDLSQLRQQIDTIDRQIVNLYEERMDVSRQVAEYKIETGKKVFDKQREQEKIAGVKALMASRKVSTWKALTFSPKNLRMAAWE